MTAAESKGLEKGGRVYWRGDAADRGVITEMSWDAVTIAWDSGYLRCDRRERLGENPEFCF
jgi:hypothetical protein